MTEPLTTIEQVEAIRFHGFAGHHDLRLFGLIEKFILITEDRALQRRAADHVGVQGMGLDPIANDAELDAYLADLRDAHGAL